MPKAPAPDITIRRAEPRDAGALSALFNDAAMLPFTAVPPFSSVAFWERKLGEYADAACQPLAAWEGETLVGLLLLRAFPNHVRRKHAASLDLLAVRVDRRRSGVGRALLDTALKAADEWLQIRRIEVVLSRVHDHGGALQRFYESFAFAVEGIQRVQLTHAGRYIDCTVMSRINAVQMPAPAAPQLPAVKRPRSTAPVKFVIRPATEDDAEGFAQVFADQSASLGTLQHPYTSADLWRTRLSANGPGNRQVMLVATVNGRAVGNAGVHPLSDNPRQRHVCGLGISIKQAYQGRGVGRALMNACLDFTDRWANYPRIELTVHADNLRAIRLYESLGFVQEGRHRDFSFRDGGYVDALFMARISASLKSSQS